MEVAAHKWGSAAIIYLYFGKAAERIVQTCERFVRVVGRALLRLPDQCAANCIRREPQATENAVIPFPVGLWLQLSALAEAGGDAALRRKGTVYNAASGGLFSNSGFAAKAPISMFALSPNMQPLGDGGPA